MLKHLATSVVAAAFAGNAWALGTTIFYGGDWDGRSGGAAQQDEYLSSAIYDDFTLSTSGALTRIGGEFLMTAAGFSQGMPYLWWEVRQGVSGGNGGAIIIPGHNSPIVVREDTGRGGWQQIVLRIIADVTGENLVLFAGTYHLAVCLVDPDSNAQMGFVTTTSGTNGLGNPLSNGNSFWNSSTFGFNFTPTQDVFGAGNWDFTYIIEAIVPVPGVIFVFGLAALAPRNRRRA